MKKETKFTPPPAAAWLAKKMAFCREKDSFVGDLEEEFCETCKGKGRIRARLWYWHQVLISVVPFLINLCLWSFIMFKNYFKIALRNLKKYKAYTFINIFGLAAGITAVILILAYIRFEISYDKFHKDVDSIYRVSVIHKKDGKHEYDSHIFTPPIGPAMKRDFPEVADFARISTPHNTYVDTGSHTFKMTGIRYASPSFFDMFSFELLSRSDEILTAPFSVVLTEKTAGKLFGHKNPLGKTIKINRANYAICGIAKDPPENSHIRFNILISFSTLYKNPRLYLDWDGGNRYITYVKLKPRAAAAMVEKKFPDLLWRNINQKVKEYGWELVAYLQPLKDIHIQYTHSSTKTNLYVFSIIALLILTLACINFINLSTARSAQRSREVGMRKVLGAERGALIRQFLFESVFLSFFAFIIGILSAELLSPIYNYLLNKNFSILGSLDINQVLILLVLIVIVGLAAGFYPAIYISSFKAVRTLKGTLEQGRSKEKFRNALVVLQFSISIALIFYTIVINQQVRFMKNMDLGFNKENIVVIPLQNNEAKEKVKILQAELSKFPGISGTTASSSVPRHGFTSNGYIPEGFKNSIMINVVDVDPDFLKTFDINMVNGRNFSAEIASDKDAYLINESLARSLNWQNPVGKTIERNGVHKVIGVVKDFKYDTLHNKIEPLIMTGRTWQDTLNYLSVKTGPGNVSRALSDIKKTWKKLVPSLPLDFFFLDEAIDNLYKKEEKFREIFLGFSILAIAIALLGLFSLASFSLEQRSKEIGIRKVLGASRNSIFLIFSKQFFLLILISNLIALPAAYYLTDKWLKNFAFRENISSWLFIFTLTGSFIMALLTIGYQVLKASNKNPVEELKHE